MQGPSPFELTLQDSALWQNEACVPKLTEAVKFAMSEQQADILEPIFKEMHLSLALDSGNIAALAIEELILT